MPKYGVWFTAQATQFIEVDVELIDGEDEINFEDRVVNLAAERLQGVPWLENIDIDQFLWDENPPEVLDD